MERKYFDGDLKSYISSRETFYAQKGILDSRINEIVYLICKTFNKKLESWWYPNAEEGDVGECDIRELESLDGSEQITITLLFKNDKWERLEVYDWDYSQGFPKYFLTMNDEDIEEQLKNEIKETARRGEEEKLKKKSKSEEKKNKIIEAKETAKKKLSKEELKLLGIK